MVHSYSQKVNINHLDDLQHVNNLTYIEWILQAAEDHWTLGADEDLRQKYVWVVLSHYVEYKRPAFLKDNLSIETWVEGCAATHCERHTVINNSTTGNLLVSAITKWCPISTKTKKPTRIIPELVEPFRR